MRVRLVITLWLSRYFEPGAAGEVSLDREVCAGTTVGELLSDVASQNPAFGEVIFGGGTGGIAGYVTVVLNDQFLELAGGMKTPLQAGDTVRLMPGFSGG